MAVCPKCSYALVLLPKRLRYKCAKCGRLYLQKFIDGREFRRRNKKQRELTKEELEREFEELWNTYKRLNKLKRDLTDEEKKQKRREYNKRYYQKNREKIFEQIKDHYQKNKERILKRNRTWMQNNREKYNKIKRDYHHRNKEQKRNYYLKNKEQILATQKKRRELKKALALQANKNNDYSPCKGKSLSQMAENYFANYFMEIFSLSKFQYQKFY